MPPIRIISAVCVLAAALGFVASVALAEVDLSGGWLVTTALYRSPVCGEFVQSGTTLTVALPSPMGEGSPFQLVGTIDPGTGEFGITGPTWTCRCGGACGCEMNGNASPDGSSLTGTLLCTAPVDIIINGHRQMTCFSFPFPVQGARRDCSERPLCPGDCDGDLEVTVGEIVIGVNIVLNRRPVGDCPVLDADGNGAVAVSELVQAVNATLIGCR